MSRAVTGRPVEPLLDDAVGTFQQLGWNGQAECGGRLTVDYELVFGDDFNGHVRGLGPLQNPVDVAWKPRICRDETRSYLCI